MVSETINEKPVIHLFSGIALYKNRREASLRLGLPLEGKADDTEIQFFRHPPCTSFSHDQKGDAH